MAALFASYSRRNKVACGVPTAVGSFFGPEQIPFAAICRRSGRVGNRRDTQALLRASGDDTSQVRELNHQPQLAAVLIEKAAGPKIANGYFISAYKTHGAGQLKRRMTMSDNVTLFPNILQPAATLKAYAPLGVKFWKNQEKALEGLKEFAEGWFDRRHKGMHAALEAAQRIGDAEKPSDILQESASCTGASTWARSRISIYAPQTGQLPK
jgi:hypothetical protein